MKADNSPCGSIYFLLFAQKKVTKEKGLPRVSAGFAGSRIPMSGAGIPRNSRFALRQRGLLFPPLAMGLRPLPQRGKNKP